MNNITVGQIYRLSDKATLITVDQVTEFTIVYHFNNKPHKSYPCNRDMFLEDLKDGMTLLPQEQ